VTDDRKRNLCFYLGVCHRKNGHLEAAEDKLMQSLPSDRRDPSWARSQYQLGCLFYEQGAFLEAKKAFELCAFFMDATDLEMKRSVPDRLAETRRRLGEPGNPQTQ
jgi:tetratricopeptide (TPR) repeat protein